MDKIIKHNGYNYNVDIVIDKNEFKYYKTDKVFIKKMFCFFPLLILNNGKFAWMKYVDVKFRLYFSNSATFDDGWTMKMHWLGLTPRWEMEDIVKEY
jgi:hypothetical protein